MAVEPQDDEVRSSLRVTARALRRIETGKDLEPELRNLRIFILECLELVGPDERLIRAADELYRLAYECAYEQEQDILFDEEPYVSPTCLQATEEALERFQAALADVRAGEKV